MYDGRTRLAQQVAEEVRTHFPEEVLATVIPRSVRVSEAPSFGQTVIAYDGQSAGAIAYREAAVEMIRRDSVNQDSANPGQREPGQREPGQREPGQRDGHWVRMPPPQTTGMPARPPMKETPDGQTDRSGTGDRCTDPDE